MANNPMDLTEKRILVTGASSGIGRAVCIYLSGLGASVILTARDETRLQETLKQMEGCAHNIYSFDLFQVNKIEDFVKSIIKDIGPLDGFVHCAGIAPMRGLSMTKPNYLQDTMLINFYSFVEFIRCISMRSCYREKASLIGLSSTAAIKGGKSQIAYAASKASIDAAMRVMAKELAPKSIRVNTIRPSLVKTEMYDAFAALSVSDDWETKISPDQYLGIIEPQDIAVAAAYLLSNASRFVTGTSLLVDGGFLS
ncbi:MAG: SDR family oxidoreductase [Oscillospiraceae bacterium]|nr:SDR family oxidoreductase [Oscillospiraceae bacterium]